MSAVPDLPEPLPCSDLGTEGVSTLRRTGRLGAQLLLIITAVLLAYLAACSSLIIAYRWIDPPTTAVQFQRRLESIAAGGEYSPEYVPKPTSEISSHVLHAVVAAEDSRFFEHRGFDWRAIETAYREGGRRGGSTISQQLAKNLFLTTHRSYLRKALEVPLTFMIEIVLPKQRILELYVNVIEWGSGVFGVEAAAQHYFRVSAEEITRRQAAALASCLPDPLRRRPRPDGWYTNVILRRMDQMGY